MKVLISTAVVMGTAGVAMSMSDWQLPMSQQAADCWRVVAFALSGVAGGLMGCCMVQFWRMRISPADKFLRILGGLAVVYFLLSLFVSVEVGDRWNTHAITWRTPYAIYIFSTSIYLLLKLFSRLQKTSQRAQARDAEVQMTICDVSNPGARVDLSSGK